MPLIQSSWAAGCLYLFHLGDRVSQTSACGLPRVKTTLRFGKVGLEPPTSCKSLSAECLDRVVSATLALQGRYDLQPSSESRRRAGSGLRLAPFSPGRLAAGKHCRLDSWIILSSRIR